MKIGVLVAVLCLGGVAASGAQAAGCIKGALVGGVVGHYAGHHGLIGAAAGCIYGRHEANQQRKAVAPPPRTNY